MRYVIVPEPVEVERVQPVEVERAGKKELSLTLELSLSSFLHDTVFVRPGWRDPKRPNRIELLIALAEKFPPTLKPGTVVALTDTEHEALAEECALRDVQLDPRNAVALARLQRAVLMARTEEPQPAVEAKGRGKRG